MTLRNAADAWLYVDGYDLTGYAISLSDPHEGMFEESHTFGDQYVEQSFVGLQKFALDYAGFYDDAAGAANEAMVTLAGASRVISWGTEGGTVGASCGGAQGSIEGKYTRSVERGKLHKANCSFAGSGQIDELKVLRKGAFNTSAGDGTALDNSASSANGGVGIQQVLATNGSFVGKIKHSVDNSTYADLIVFTTVTSGNIAAQRSTVAGTVNRYLRSNWAGPTATTAMQSFKRNA